MGPGQTQRQVAIGLYVIALTLSVAAMVQAFRDAPTTVSSSLTFLSVVCGLAGLGLTRKVRR